MCGYYIRPRPVYGQQLPCRNDFELGVEMPPQEHILKDTTLSSVLLICKLVGVSGLAPLSSKTF